MIAIAAAAVTIFVPYGMRMSKYDYIEKEILELDSYTENMIRDRREDYRPIFGRKITIGAVSYTHLAKTIIAILMVKEKIASGKLQVNKK